MIITKEQQLKLLDTYSYKERKTDELCGFIDGINATLELVDKILKQ